MCSQASVGVNDTVNLALPCSKENIVKQINYKSISLFDHNINGISVYNSLQVIYGFINLLVDELELEYLDLLRQLLFRGFPLQLALHQHQAARVLLFEQRHHY